MTQIAKAPGSMSIIYRFDAKVSDRYPIDVVRGSLLYGERHDASKHYGSYLYSDFIDVHDGLPITIVADNEVILSLP